jgi:hypothetical protein
VAPEGGRHGYQLLLDLAGFNLGWRQRALADYLASHAPGFVSSADRIAECFRVTAKTVREWLKPLRDAGIAEHMRVRDIEGKIVMQG